MHSYGMPNRRSEPSILVVEDERVQRTALAAYLEREGLQVHEADGGTTMWQVLENHTVDLVLLDVRLPGEDGFVLARRMRERWPRLGVIMVTAKQDTVDRIVGLETGADDYIVKPFDPRELLARVKSVLRRLHSALASDAPRAQLPTNVVPMGRWLLDLEQHILRAADGATEPLTATEFDLLKVFAEHPDRPLTRDWLLQVTSHRDLDPFDRSIDLRITRLRKKIEPDPQKPTVLRTVRGVGYMFCLHAAE